MKRSFQQSNSLLALLLGMLVSAGCSELFMNYTEPEWNAVAVHSDGRRFVTDGKIAIDASVAEVDDLPSEGGSTAWFEGPLRDQGFAERRELFDITNLKNSEQDPNRAEGPAGLVLEAYQVEYLRGKFFGDKITFWQGRNMEPLVIIVNDQPVGAVKVISQGQR